MEVVIGILCVVVALLTAAVVLLFVSVRNWQRNYGELVKVNTYLHMSTRNMVVACGQRLSQLGSRGEPFPTMQEDLTANMERILQSEPRRG